MLDYNEIIQVYLNPANTPQTRSQIFNNIEPLKTMFDKILIGSRTLLEKSYSEDEAELCKTFFVKYIEGVCVV